jgi:anti-sigma regulatory factor (Ser/Thr protein kinase)
MESRDFTASFSNFDLMMNFIRDSMKKFVKSEENMMQFEVAIEEALVNIIKYGYSSPSGTIEIACGFLPSDRSLVVKITDRGIPFNPLDTQELKAPKALESQNLGGLGLHFIKNMADSVTYEYKDGKNQLTLKKRLTF